MFIINGANSDDPWPQPNDGMWKGFSFQGNAGRSGFESGIESCNSPKINPDAAMGVTMPGNNPYANWAANVIAGGSRGNNDYAGICKFKSNTDAGCYANVADAAPGVTINAVWGDLMTNGSNGIDFRYVGEFQLTCFYQAANAQCTAPGAQKPGAPAGPYPIGTMVGYLKRLKPRFITPDDVLGNTLSNVQRIILVR
jgi:hypothetical protein